MRVFAYDVPCFRSIHGELTRQRLAGIVVVSRQTVNAIEHSKSLLSLEVAFRIARAFNASVEDIFVYVPDIEGDHEFADGVEAEISWDGSQDGNTGSVER